ncbi:uncharacterized protein LOC143034367 [Oratosquilla oratoria]|uniref:uncharacterized protein LOC143034367 n=1 Tax=Oratosquilla oratoria TaxID=337810 RepID=UPI003F774AE7
MFELASAHAILNAQVQREVQGRFLAWIDDYLLHRRVQVKFHGHLSAYRELENGTPQAGVLSPVLLNLLMEQLVILPFRGGRANLNYADDLVLVDEAIISPEPKRRLIFSLTSAKNWASRFQLRSPRP